uniref:BHLH domain-containing protein n=1 Tax=Nelumbo nucifera TaxID=4432 RepID=A0A822ZHM4_NELNU|nr:TPA_asm: hypothetical protein HUJ06_002250 [Nelumbo nucifera]
MGEQPSPNGKKRKRVPESHSQLDPRQSEIEPQRDASQETLVSLKEQNAGTNSHLLHPYFEHVYFNIWVRREKISERVRYLQDLVPGCNKITGKAVMLDQIINYVQSLQRQVEFLSVKLATVNPEINIDIEQVLSKYKFFICGGGSSGILGFTPAMSSSHPQHITPPEGAFLVPSAREDELQSALQLGFVPNPAVNNLGQNGSMKAEP